MRAFKHGLGLPPFPYIGLVSPTLLSRSANSVRQNQAGTRRIT
jgi:hypothetical protein